MFYVYILRCSDGSYYTGHTEDLALRVAGHQQGVVDSYTSRRRPLELVFSQALPTPEEAVSAEMQIKGWSRKKKEALMKHDWNELVRLSSQKSVHGSTGSPRTE